MHLLLTLNGIGLHFREVCVGVLEQLEELVVGLVEAPHVVVEFFINRFLLLEHVLHLSDR